MGISLSRAAVADSVGLNSFSSAVFSSCKIYHVGFAVLIIYPSICTRDHVE